MYDGKISWAKWSFRLSLFFTFLILIEGKQANVYLCCKLCLFKLGTPQFIDCPSSVCLSRPVSYVCSVNTTGTGADSLRWEVLDTDNNRVGSAITYDINQQLGVVRSIGSNFTTNITASAGPIVSDISFTPTLSISGYTVECQARGSGLFPPVTCPITIPGMLVKVL